MFPFVYLLAIFLLMTDFDLGINPDWFVNLRETMQKIAIGWEILDPREVRYVLTRSEDFSSDLKLLRRRHADLFDAPPMYDCQRFPDRALISDLLAFNRAYRNHLNELVKIEFVHPWELRQATQDTDKLYQVWDTLRDARCDYFYITVRRQALKRLREYLGPEDYYAGNLPPYVPLWFYRRIE